jgi:hypothetical protein
MSMKIPDRPLPGTLFLKMTRRIFSEHMIATVFSPAVADFRQELGEAGTGRLGELAVRVRVAGDGPGLIFAVGTVLIVVIGLPGFWWFFVAAALGSLLVAWSLFVRRSMELPPVKSLLRRNLS